MDQEIKIKWVEALKSGKYKQGRGQLRSLNNEFCCLGVLADITECNWETEEDGGYCYKTKNPDSGLFETHSCYVPFDFLSFKVQKELTDLNDYHASSFPEVADWIEKNL